MQLPAIALRSLRTRLAWHVCGTGHVTHGRKQQILPAEVAELRYYVLNVIHVMIRNPQKWDSRQALHEWIDDLRLS